MLRRPVRRAQLIAPFGTGAMMVAPDGTSLIAAGLDHWFAPSTPSTVVDPTEFQFHEWRLERELDVDHFALPPDHRASRWEPWRPVEPNQGLKIPFLRFPQWHVCPSCSQMEFFPLELKDRPRCPSCSENLKPGQRRAPTMVQVRFIAICQDGHIQDFPWREWVHKREKPSCLQPMRLFGTGGTSLAATLVICGCGAKRNLEGITHGARRRQSPNSGDEDGEASGSSTVLSEELTGDGSPFLCRGMRPWLAEHEGAGCPRPLWGSLRGATNVYFGATRSAIYLPRGSDLIPSKLVAMLEEAPIAGTRSLIEGLGGKPTPSQLKRQHPSLLAPYSDDQLSAALEVLERQVVVDTTIDEDPETAFRRDEFAALRSELKEDQLKTRPVPLARYDQTLAALLQTVVLVERVRETRASTGFSRLTAENGQALEERKTMLWREPPQRPDRWLPAYKVYGEGIYFELDEERLRAWENRESVTRRIQQLDRHFDVVRRNRGLSERRITPRFVLLHTFAHVLMNQLIFDCGYSSASLRERLYVSGNPDTPMGGVLVYTASGDAEGTMGGLVRMGKPHHLERVVNAAIAHARWCSSDPVCMELGAAGGQGPDSCNLAACHNCALVPETSCEEFNRFLDRWTLVGDPSDPGEGFFSSLVH